MSPGMKGCQGELIASLWLMDNGYHVFRNVAPEGPVDIVAMNLGTGQITLFDVKSHEGQSYKGKWYPPRASLKRSADQIRLGVKILWVCNGECTIVETLE